MAALCRKCLKKVPPESERCLFCRTPVEKAHAALGSVEVKAGPGRPPEIVAAVTHAADIRAFEPAGGGSVGGLTFAQMAQEIAEVSVTTDPEQSERIDFGTLTLSGRAERGGRKAGFKWPFRKDDGSGRKTSVRTA